MVVMANGIARRCVGTTTTTESHNMAAILQKKIDKDIKPWFTVYFFDVGRPCQDQLTPVNTVYPLSIQGIRWPVSRGHIAGSSLLEVTSFVELKNCITTATNRWECRILTRPGSVGILEYKIYDPLFFTVSFHFGHFCRLDQCAVYILFFWNWPLTKSWFSNRLIVRSLGHLNSLWWDDNSRSFEAFCNYCGDRLMRQIAFKVHCFDDPLRVQIL